MTEGAIYEATKQLLRDRGWRIIAGQPPRGSDSVPCIEIKSPSTYTKGSLGSFKPDLVATRAGIVLLVECKPLHSDADAEKLRSILGDDDRIAQLHAEFEQRSMVPRHGLPATIAELGESLRGALAHAGDVEEQPDLAIIQVTSPRGEGRIILPGRSDPDLEAAMR